MMMLLRDGPAAGAYCTLAPDGQAHYGHWHLLSCSTVCDLPLTDLTYYDSTVPTVQYYQSITVLYCPHAAAAFSSATGRLTARVSISIIATQTLELALACVADLSCVDVDCASVPFPAVTGSGSGWQIIGTGGPARRRARPVHTAAAATGLTESRSVPIRQPG